MHGQHLANAPTLTRAVDVVQMLGAVQSQDYAGAKWAIGMRATGLTDTDIDRAFDAGEILRTHVMRPTWHFVAAEDLLWMQRLTGHRVAAKMTSYNTTLGLTPAMFRKSHKTIEKSLANHQYRTRTQLKAVLDKAGVNTEGTQRLAHLMMQAELDGLICSGPRVGKQFTYALVSERAPTSRELEGDDALAELTRRYFASRAPATVHDYAWWSGLPISTCRRGVALLDRELQSLTVGDAVYFVPPNFDLPDATHDAVHLLPNYDEYFIGYRDRSAIGQRLKDLALVTGGNALIAHVVSVGGQLVGGWKRVARSGGHDVELNLVAKLTKAEQKRVENTVRELQTFLLGS